MTAEQILDDLLLAWVLDIESVPFPTIQPPERTNR